MDFYLQQVEGAILSATSGMTTEQLQWHPERKWSAAEILEHLMLTYSGTAIVFGRCLQAGKPSATVPTVKEHLHALVGVKLGYLPEGRQAPVGTRAEGHAGRHDCCGHTPPD